MFHMLSHQGSRLVLHIGNNEQKPANVRMNFIWTQAKELQLDGYIRAIEGGVVEVLLEGEKPELDTFITFVLSTFGQYEKIDYKFSPATDEFDLVQVV